MSLAPGTRLGAYEVVGLLGAGGMGQVYRARDTVLGRDVALKTLPDSVTADPDRLARFRREAQLLAALNHPHIAGIYGLDESGGRQVLVLEFVEGPTLADRLAHGPLPVDEAVAIAIEIGEALQAAHEKGIVHRDLKPANIALTATDRVKVLDFGLAKATAPLTTPEADVVNSPTITSAGRTAAGVILGTAAYMSPEQAKGRAADKRSDVWAFGCVLFELLAGRRPFRGEDVSDTVAAVLQSPPRWEDLPPSVPPEIRALLHGCLEKNPRDRVGDISAALYVLKSARLQPVHVPAPRRRVSWMSLALVLLAMAGVAAAAAAAAWRFRPAAPVPLVARFNVPVDGDRQLTLSRNVLAVSSDGGRIVYAADGRLYLRRLSELESRAIPGADPAIQPAFSPDGLSLAYWATPALKRISVDGGVPVTICQSVSAPFGINWGEHGIVFVQPGRGIMRVGPAGGEPEMLVSLQNGDSMAHSPQILPDGKTLIYSASTLDNSDSNFWDRGRIIARSLESGQETTLVTGGSDGRYLPTGHLVYMVEGTLMAVPLDLSRMQVTGSAVPVVEGIRRASASAGGGAMVAFADAGVLAYVPGPGRTGRDDLFIYDRTGAATPLKLPPGSYIHPRVSPDGQHVAFETTDGKNAVISLYEISGTNSARRLTFGGNNRLPIWSRDGRRVVYQSDREGDLGLFWQPAEGGPAERMTRAAAGEIHVAEAWSPRSDVLLYRVTKDNESTLWTMSLPDRTATRYSDVKSHGVPTNATFSPDGNWIAYQSGSERGGGEATVYVQPFPATGTTYEIARGGRPLWAPDGKTLFFVPAPSLFYGVNVRYAPSFSVTAPHALRRVFGLAPPASPRPYDVLPDGRIVAADLASRVGESRAEQIHVVVNWFEELKTKLPVDK